ncbi:MAG TPA: AMP-binding protein [Actinomycetota bacterium]|nr:AMP-binding protein [Actinomycetota bacterium]
MTVRPGGAALNISAGIREFAVATPGATAVVDGERALTYAALDDRARRFGNALLAAGLTPGDRVAVVLGNRLEYPEIAAGIARVGMQMVPVNPRLTAPEVTYIVGHSEARATVVDESLSGTVAPALGEHDQRLVLSIDGTSLGPSYETALEKAPAADAGIEVDEREPFCVAYTSGTTGRPKGVMISHRSRSLTFYGTALEWGLGPGRRTIAVAPMYHGAGFAFGFGALHVGGELWMLRSFDAEPFLAMCAQSRAQSVFLVPTHAQMIRALGDDATMIYDLTGLETLYFNAAPMPHPLKLWVADAFPHVALHELYGSTEAGIVSNCRPADVLRKPGSVGPPWFMTEVRVVDEDGNPVAPGGTGELFSRSPFLMNGYLKDDEATLACTTPDGFLSSGDVAREDEDGFLYIVDRTKDMIISGGTNVYPREVEDVLITHPEVRDVAVAGLPDETWGEQVAAFVVVAPGSNAGDKELDAHCRASLAGFKIPRRYVFLDALPRNAAGKILKRELRDRYA